ncbi:MULTISPECIES: hypothetical protein [unclassified Haladaptatus]|uniref:hypothetical protein n=1 Tax=unclassified Haladaptatus TaxID=2622732 RepID=UPI002FCDE3CE
MSSQYRCPVKGCAFLVRADDENHVLTMAVKHHELKHDTPVSGAEVRRTMTLV